ncbi:MAG: Lrp/AsnC family transcriptional regulator [Candidatus Margulisbacteria bacterium]|nr:Lrp/AsnC family transcriptional regulator [Candidatus Margulisiibacteriota bacterium]
MIIKEKLTQILKENSRLANADIAKMIGISEKEVDSLIKELEADKIILKYTAVINDELLDNGQSVTAFIEVKVTPERDKGFDSLGERLQKFSEVKSVYLMSGAYDILVVVEGKSLKDIASFVSKKLSPIGRILSTATHFQLKKYKENGVIMGTIECEGSSRLNVAF